MNGHRFSFGQYKGDLIIDRILLIELIISSFVIVKNIKLGTDGREI